MKVEFQCGDTITIPEGCKAIVKGKSVVFEKEEKEEVQEFKDGDVLCSIYDNTVLIFKDVSKYYRGCFDSHYNDKGSGDKHWNSEFFRHATDEERQLLFDKMREKGLRWNAEKKRVEHLIWRADVGEDYYFINSSLNVRKLEECWSVFSEELYSAANYFRTKEQAEEVIKRMKEVLYKYHEEIGE